mmetsp:Transcript_101414/g.295486  ORF Transcript_101414/g.295486 Transcript_101414/m.295486 type:complete len:243 (+) Transcript_101414:1064-1792(+)
MLCLRRAHRRVRDAVRRRVRPGLQRHSARCRHQRGALRGARRGRRFRLQQEGGQGPRRGRQPGRSRRGRQAMPARRRRDLRRHSDPRGQGHSGHCRCSSCGRGGGPGPAGEDGQGRRAVAPQRHRVGAGRVWGLCLQHRQPRRAAGVPREHGWRRPRGARRGCARVPKQVWSLGHRPRGGEYRMQESLEELFGEITVNAVSGAHSHTSDLLSACALFTVHAATCFPVVSHSGQRVGRSAAAG